MFKYTPVLEAPFIDLLAWALGAVLLPNFPFSQVCWGGFRVFLVTSCEAWAKTRLRGLRL